MDVPIGPDGRAGSVGQNYALRPGDHVIVNLNEESSFKDFLKKIGIE
jgi:hypothetical protein